MWRAIKLSIEKNIRDSHFVFFSQQTFVRSLILLSNKAMAVNVFSRPIFADYFPALLLSVSWNFAVLAPFSVMIIVTYRPFIKGLRF
jgi:hypothetical protein